MKFLFLIEMVIKQSKLLIYVLKDTSLRLVLNFNHLYFFRFRGLGIVHMAKKNLTKELVRKKEIYFLEKLKTKVPLVDDAKLKSELKRHLSEVGI